MIAVPGVAIATIDHSVATPMTIPPVNLGRGWTSIFDTTPISKEEMEMLHGCQFLPRDAVVNHLKSRGWTPQYATVMVYTILEDITRQCAMNKRLEVFVLPRDGERLYLKLANLSDTHGIVSLHSGAIWLAEAKDPRNLNIDADAMGEIGDILSDESPEMAAASSMQGSLKVIRNSLYGTFGRGGHR